MIKAPVLNKCVNTFVPDCRYVHVDHLIRAHDKGPNRVGEIEISVPELRDQSVPVLDTELVSNDVSQSTNEKSEPSSCKES